jgi:hypothetical protein
VREKFSCRDCETITQPPASFHVTSRGFAGPQLLAMILFEKFGQHQPLNRQSDRYRRRSRSRIDSRSSRPFMSRQPTATFPFRDRLTLYGEVGEELRSRLNAGNMQPVAGAGAGDVEQVALAVVNLIEF